MGMKMWMDGIGDTNDFLDREGSPLSQHCLDGYLPDDSSNPTSMEENGNYPEALTLMYGDLHAGGIDDQLYNFDDIWKCLK